MATTPVAIKRTEPVANTVTEPWQVLRREMDRLFDRFTAGFNLPPMGRLIDADTAVGAPILFNLPTPAIDIAETAEGFRLTAELPGMTEKDIEVTVADDTLTLKGEKKQETEQKEKNYYLSERSYGVFQRSFVLPSGVDREKVAATFEKGVLTVMLPKAAVTTPQTRKIDVKAAA